MRFQVYYVCDEDRIDAIKTFSIIKRFRWVEQGIAMASWEYRKIGEVDKESISEVKKQYSELTFDKRRRTFQRTINIGDVVICGNEACVFTPVGWLRVPEIVWEKTKKK